MSGIQFPPVYTVKSVAELAKECLGAIVAQCYDPADQLGGFRTAMCLFKIQVSYYC